MSVRRKEWLRDGLTGILVHLSSVMPKLLTRSQNSCCASIVHSPEARIGSRSSASRIDLPVTCRLPRPISRGGPGVTGPDDRVLYCRWHQPRVVLAHEYPSASSVHVLCPLPAAYIDPIRKHKGMEARHNTAPYAIPQGQRVMYI